MNTFTEALIIGFIVAHSSCYWSHDRNEMEEETDGDVDDIVDHNNNTCENAIVVTPPFFEFMGEFDDFTDSRSNVDSCSPLPGPDVWFEIVVPENGSLFVNEHAPQSDVFIAAVDSCSMSEDVLCLFHDPDDPERFSWVNDTGEDTTLWMAVNGLASGPNPDYWPTTWEMRLEFVTASAPPSANRCDRPEVLDMLEIDERYVLAIDTRRALCNGEECRFRGDWTCSPSDDPGYWLEASVPGGHVLTIAAPFSGEPTFNILEGGCGSTSCLSSGYGDLEWVNYSDDDRDVVIVAYPDLTSSLETLVLWIDMFEYIDV